MAGPRELRIREAKNGWIILAPWPYGGRPAGFGEVVFQEWDDVLKLLKRIFDIED